MGLTTNHPAPRLADPAQSQHTEVDTDCAVYLNEGRVGCDACTSSAPDLDQQAAVVACTPLFDAVQRARLHALVEAA